MRQEEINKQFDPTDEPATVDSHPGGEEDLKSHEHGEDDLIDNLPDSHPEPPPAKKS